MVTGEETSGSQRLLRQRGLRLLNTKKTRNNLRQLTKVKTCVTLDIKRGENIIVLLKKVRLNELEMDKIEITQHFSDIQYGLFIRKSGQCFLKEVRFDEFMVTMNSKFSSQDNYTIDNCLVQSIKNLLLKLCT